MKNILYILGISILLFVSCTDEVDEVFNESPELRLSGVLSNYQSTLVKGDGQWITYYGGEAILMHFEEDGTVQFKSTFNNGKDDRTITYRVGASQVPELIFENHSVFHALYELDRSNREYEFLFEEVSDTEIKLVSKTDLGAEKTKVIFIKGIPEDIDDAAKLKPVIDSLSYFKDIFVDGENTNIRVVSFSGATYLKEIQDDGLIVSTPYDMGITKDGVIFVPALNIGGVQVSSFKYDAETNVFTGQDVDKVIEIRVSTDSHKSSTGVYDAFMQSDFKGLSGYSYKMDSIPVYLHNDVANFSGVQFYVNRGWLLAYAPGSADGNWAGLSDFHFNKSVDSDNMLVTWDYLVWGGSFWKAFYYSKGGQMLVHELLLDPSGLYIDEIGKGKFVLVSLSDPSKYVLLED